MVAQLKSGLNIAEGDRQRMTVRTIQGASRAKRLVGRDKTTLSTADQLGLPDDVSLLNVGELQRRLAQALAALQAAEERAADRDKLEGQLAEVSNRLSTVSREREGYKAAYRGSEDALKVAQRALKEPANLKDMLDKKKAKLADANARLQQLSQDNERLEKELQRTNDKMRRAVNGGDKVKARSAEQKKEITALKRTLTATEKKLERLRRRVQKSVDATAAAYEKKLEAAKQNEMEAASNSKGSDKLKRSLEDKKSEITALKRALTATEKKLERMQARMQKSVDVTAAAYEKKLQTAKQKEAKTAAALKECKASKRSRRS